MLREICRNNSILFTVVSERPEGPDLFEVALPVVKDLQQHNEDYNLAQALGSLDSACKTWKGKLETMLVFDADKTLAAQVTGSIFWKEAPHHLSEWNGDPLKEIFSRQQLGYSYTAFRQATMLYEEYLSDENFEARCQDVASAVIMHPEMFALLERVAKKEHVGAVVVTCGLRRVWEIVMERHCLSKQVKSSVEGASRMVSS